MLRRIKQGMSRSPKRIAATAATATVLSGILLIGCCSAPGRNAALESSPHETAGGIAMNVPADIDRDDRISVLRVQQAFNEFNYDNPAVLEQIYEPDVSFRDPITQLEGLDALRDYYLRLYKNVDDIRFEFGETIETDGQVVLTWTMHLKHKSFNGGETIVVPGASHLRFREKIVYHRDYFDVGAMVYEHVPVLGFFVRNIKDRL